MHARDDDDSTETRGARARTHKLMLETATALMQRGETPSVTEVAEAAGVSRATAYRYFATETELVLAVVEAGFAPLAGWTSDSKDAADRVDELIAESLPRLDEFEATFRAALRLGLARWSRGEADENTELQLGQRLDLLQTALAPLRKTLPRAQFRRLAMALSLTYSLEAMVVFKDLWGASRREVLELSQWASRALIKAANTGAAQKRKAVAKAARPTPAARKTAKKTAAKKAPAKKSRR